MCKVCHSRGKETEGKGKLLYLFEVNPSGKQLPGKGPMFFIVNSGIIIIGVYVQNSLKQCTEKR